MDDYIIKFKTYDNVTDPRLGRNIKHDSRSLLYKAPESDLSTLKSVRHQRNIPVLDQGDLGSCTGNAGTGCLGTAAFWETTNTILSPTDANMDEQFAIKLYSDATKADNYQGDYPPDDTGSDGLSIAKVLKSRGLISGYTHATSLNAAITALATQPVIVGIDWYNDMFNPDADGRVHPTGGVAGGHEIVFDELDVENQRLWFTNSWGTSWGVDGRAYLTYDDFNKLMKRDGDVTVFTPITAPAPQPTPTPTPEPTPTPDENILEKVVDKVEAVFDDLIKFLKSL